MFEETNAIRAVACAAKLIDSYYLTGPEDIDLEAIAMDQNLLILEEDIGGAEAHLVQNGKKGIITIRKNDSAVRKRFSIAHEMGHWFLHKDSRSFEFCSPSDMVEYERRKVAEYEANIFASEFLLPRKFVYPRFREQEPNWDFLLEKANEFKTSLTATAIRYVDMTKEKCFLVCSENSKVKWWRKNSSTLFLQAGQALTNRTHASMCFTGGLKRAEIKSVPASAWFDDIDPKLCVEVKEQSIKLGSLPYVLTLLWVFENEKQDDDEEDY